MTSRALARAFANIALCKYWGKLPGARNLPATPSISLALDALITETEVKFIPDGPDLFFIDGRKADQPSEQRLKAFLKLWRKAGLIKGHFSIDSRNKFPTASGLASSASGFAALTMALSAFSPRKMGGAALSRLARQGSGSAARSRVGGLAKRPTGPDPAATVIAPAERIPWGMVIAVVKAGSKAIGSREGMEITRRHSPYYKNWLIQARRDYGAMLKAIDRLDFTAVGEICERNTLAMHACMLASRPSLLYMNEYTVRALAAVWEWRKAGLEIYFTCDAGPHPVILCRLNDLQSVCKRVMELEGVSSALPGAPAGGAVLIERQ